VHPVELVERCVLGVPRERLEIEPALARVDEGILGRARELLGPISRWQRARVAVVPLLVAAGCSDQEGTSIP
jgi:hypothetical protein